MPGSASANAGRAGRVRRHLRAAPQRCLHAQQPHHWCALPLCNMPGLPFCTHNAWMRSREENLRSYGLTEAAPSPWLRFGCGQALAKNAFDKSGMSNDMRQGPSCGSASPGGEPFKQDCNC